MGIPRAPVYPEIPSEPLTEIQVESLDTWQNIDEHRQLVEGLFEIGTPNQYRLTEEDIAARQAQIAFSKSRGHFQTRDARQLGQFFHATVAQIEDEVRKKSMLDIGCGFGRFGEAMARNAKAKVTFLDREQEVLDRISKRAGQIVSGEGTSLPFEDESYDRVFSSFSSVHWAETPLESVKAMNEALRVTKIGGTALIVPLFNSISQRRLLLPKIFSERTNSRWAEPVLDGYAAVWALQDYTLIKGLFGLADKKYISVTWNNNLEQTHIPGVSQEIYSAVIDKQKAIPHDEFEAVEAQAAEFMPIGNS